MLIEWQAIGVLAEAIDFLATRRDGLALVVQSRLNRILKQLEIPAEPVRERCVDLPHRFGPRIHRATGGGAAAAGLQRNDHGDSFVKRASDERRLAVARVADDGDPLGIDGAVGAALDKIHNSMKTPGPE